MVVDLMVDMAEVHGNRTHPSPRDDTPDLKSGGPTSEPCTSVIWIKHINYNHARPVGKFFSLGLALPRSLSPAAAFLAPCFPSPLTSDPEL